MFENEKLYISELKSVTYTEGQTTQKASLRCSHVFGFCASNYGLVENCGFFGNVVGLYSNVFSQNNKKGKFENCYCFDNYDTNTIPNVISVSPSDIDAVCNSLNSNPASNSNKTGIDIDDLTSWKPGLNSPVQIPKNTGTVDKSTEDGSKEHPFTISSADEFIQFIDNINGKNNYVGKYIIQTVDIDLSGRTDYDGANGSGYPYIFSGTYDGCGHTINVELDTSGQTVNNTIFPYIDGIVMNLGVTGIISCGGLYTSGFARSVRKKGTVVNCYSCATVSTRSEHGTVYELSCILSGKAVVFYEGESYVLKSGSVIYIPKGINPSDYHIEFESPVNSISVFFDTGYAMPEKLFVSETESSKNIEVQFDKIYRTWIGRKSKYYLNCMSLLYEVIAALSKPSGNYIPKDKYTKIQAGIEYLTNHCFDKDIDYNEPSRICGISYTYFKQLFIQKFRNPPIGYITEVRMERAAELLSTGIVSVTEIAELCGYENIYYFSKVFKKYYGVSPKKYLKS